MGETPPGCALLKYVSVVKGGHGCLFVEYTRFSHVLSKPRSNKPLGHMHGAHASDPSRRESILFRQFQTCLRRETAQSTRRAVHILGQPWALFTLVYVAMDSHIDSPLEPWSTTTFEAQYSTMPELPWVEGVTSTVSMS